MNKLVSALLITAMAAVGCGTESEPGGPGADQAPRGANGANGNGGERGLLNEENTFTMTVPSGATSVQAGASQAVTISINRGDQFHEAVTLEFSAPAGVTVEPQSPTLNAGQEEVDLTVTVPAGTRPGEHTINVMATPASGQNPVNSSFKIEVEAAEGVNGAQPPAGGRQPLERQPTGLQPNGLQPNGLQPNGLQPNGLQPGQQPAEQPPADPTPTEQP